MNDQIDLPGSFPGANINIKSPVYQLAPPAPVDPGLLEKAIALFAALPLKAIPLPTVLPTGSRVPFSRNALFTGREADLRMLATALRRGETAAVGQIAAATGLGGIGKTQLANEFVYRYGQYFSGGVYWINCADASAIANEVALCGGAGFLDLRPDYGHLPLHDQVSLVASAWQSPIPRLLVFDNCEEEELLAQWRPPSGACHVIVTSRRPSWSRELGVQPLALGVLSPEEGTDLLGKHRPDLAASRASLEAIAAELGYLPLALHLAGSFLSKYRHSALGDPAAYLEKLHDPNLLQHRSLTGGGRSPTGHEQHVARTFAMSYAPLLTDAPQDVLGLFLLERAACFAPGEPIPRDLLSGSLETETKAESDARTLANEDALARITALGLIESLDSGALVMHRLVQVFVRGEAKDFSQAQTAVEDFVVMMALGLSRAGYNHPLNAWVPHLKWMAEMAVERGSEQAGRLYVVLGYELAKYADDAEARACYERALAIHEAAYGPEHPEVARDVNNIGTILHKQGDLDGAKEHFERALAIDEAAYGPEHHLVATTVSNLGIILREQGDLAGAKKHLERALAIDETAYGSEHPTVGAIASNLGAVLHYQGDLAGAMACYERALAIYEAAFGTEYTGVALVANNLGTVLCDQGDLAGAKACFERALAIDMAAYGPKHPAVARDVRNLGAMCHDQGDQAVMGKHFEQALTIFETVLGNEDPRVLKLRATLGAPSE